MLIVKKLSKNFHIPTFKPISFKLNKSEVMQVIGPNGVGKTTLLKCLANYLSSDFETLTYNKHKLQASDTAYASTDERSFFPKLTLKENFLFFKSFYKSSPCLEEWSEKFEVTSYLNKEFQACSTGIKKRASLIRAIIKDSPILLLDEPFANMDLNFKNELQVLLFENSDLRRKMLIFTSNNPLQHKAIHKTLTLEAVEKQ